MKRIADRLGISYRTVAFHKYRMMERLGIKTNAGLLIYALKRNPGVAGPSEEPSRHIPRPGFDSATAP